MTVITIFHVEAGVGCTTLTQHLAVMASRLGRRVLAVDLDPQAALTATLVPALERADLWAEHRAPTTVADALAPVLDAFTQPLAVAPRELDDRLWLLPGDLALASAEEFLAQCWPGVVAGNEGALRATTAIHRVIASAAEQVDADVVLLDLGPNLGALTRAAMLATDHVVTPVLPTAASVLSLGQVGAALDRWRSTWRSVITREPAPRGLDVSPAGSMRPAGYLLRDPVLRFDRPVIPHGQWLQRLPAAYAESVLGDAAPALDQQIARVPDYSIALSMAREAEKVIFDLTPVDGATGSVMGYVMKCRQQLEDITRAVLTRVETSPPGPSTESAGSAGSSATGKRIA